MNGKGSAPRPIPDRAKYEENWDRIFRKQCAHEWKDEKCVKCGQQREPIPFAGWIGEEEK